MCQKEKKELNIVSKKEGVNMVRRNIREIRNNLKKIKNAIKVHKSHLKGYFGGIAFTIKINLIIYMLMWMNIISHSYTDFQFLSIIIKLSIFLMISSLLTTWLFKNKQDMILALKMSVFNTGFMYFLGIYNSGMPLS